MNEKAIRRIGWNQAIAVALKDGSSLANVQRLGSRTKPDKMWATIHDTDLLMPKHTYPEVAAIP